MNTHKKIILQEPKHYGITKFKLYNSLLIIIVFSGVLIFENDLKKIPIIVYVAIGLYFLYLLLPFTYKLIISNQSITLINQFKHKTIDWNKLSQIELKNEDVILTSLDQDIKIKINKQSDSLPEILDFIKHQRPELWPVNNIQIFHKSYVESIFLIIVSLATLSFWIYGVSLGEGKTGTTLSKLLSAILFMLPAIYGLFKIRKVSIENDHLVVQYIIWKREFHVNNVISSSLDQQLGKNLGAYYVSINIKGTKGIVIDKVKEGNPLLVEAINKWVEKYKGKDNA